MRIFVRNRDYLYNLGDSVAGMLAYEDCLLAYHYQAYGLVFDSEIQLPGLLETEAPVQVRIVVDESLIKPMYVPSTTGARYIEYDPANCRAVYYYEQFGLVLIENGDSIRIKPDVEMDTAILVQTLFSFPIRMLLQQRDVFLLHASVVALHDASVAFCGRSGMGKSTLAAHFHIQGYPLVTDDTLAAEVNASGGIKLYAGVPQLKLWPDSLVSIGKCPDEFTRLLASRQKRIYSDIPYFKGTPPPLKRIYILAGQSEEVGRIEALSPSQALQALFSQSFIGELVKEGKDTLFKNQQAQIEYFMKYTLVAQKVPVRRLWRQFDLAALPQLVSLIVQDLNSSP